MAVNPAPTTTGNGLKNVIDIIIAPGEALESLGIAPTWGWAFLVTVILFAVGSFLMTPAMIHAMTAAWPSMIAQNPRLAAESADQQAVALSFSLKIVQFTWIFIVIFVPIYFLISTVIMTIFNAIGRGVGTFGKFWAASCNIGVIAGLATFVVGIITVVRGPESFNTMLSVQGSMPSLAWIAPGSGPHLFAFLAGFTPFSLWMTWLVAQALLVIGRVPKLQAWLAAAVGILVPALLGAMGAK